MYTIDNFILDIESANPESSTHCENLYSGNNQNGSIRKHNLKVYLEYMKSLDPKILLLGEAPGHKGCRLTGVPFTSEKILKNHPFFTNQSFQFINQHPESEQSATIVWNTLSNFRNVPLIWNIFPFHPFDGNHCNTNRTPNKKELEYGKHFMIKLLQLFSIELIVAIGRKAESQVSDLNIKYKYVRHPANGGKNKFIQGITEILQHSKYQTKPMNFTYLSFKNIERDAKNITFDDKDSYIRAYPEFIKYFQTINHIENHHLIIASHFVYGWMPTILTLKLDNIDQVLALFNEVKNGKMLNENELETLKPCINNSMVGLSKLLHFIHPENYAIWDSRILKYTTGQTSQYGIDKPRNYLSYIKKLNKIKMEKGFPHLLSTIQKHFKYPLTAMRTMEIVMFQKQKNEQA